MSIREKLDFFISNHTETAEKHFREEMRTRYYKASKDKVIQAVESVINKDGLVVKRVESERGEVIAHQRKGKKILLVATIVTVRPFKTAVDWSCSTDTILPSDFGYSRKVIGGLYEKLDKELTYIGSGLGEELL